MMQKVASGVFTWDGAERRTDRYGAFVIDGETYPGTAMLDLEALRALAGKRVRLAAVAVEVRQSGHVGDLAHGIFPSTPAVGERVELGVGVLRLAQIQWASSLATAIELAPEDGRRFFWIDPRKLYRLHEQTVDLFVEETADAPHDAPDLTKAEASCIGVDEVERSIQVKQVDLDRDKLTLEPKFERIGDGMFTVTPQEVKRGESIDFAVNGRPHRRKR